MPMELKKTRTSSTFRAFYSSCMENWAAFYKATYRQYRDGKKTNEQT